jgi:CheY-like chemotaxis protein
LFIPGLKGTEVLRRLKADDDLADIPVVMISGSLDPKDREECEQLGTAAFLSKPIDYETVVEIVGHLLLNERLGGSEWG